MDKGDAIFFGNLFIIGFAGMLTHLSISPASFTALAILMFIDFCMGVGKSVKLGKDITSYKARVGGISKVGTLIIIIALGIALRYSGVEVMEPETYIKWVLTMFILAELYSIISNFHAIKTGKELPEVEVIGILGNKIRDILTRLLPPNEDNKDDKQRNN